ncbi:MAG: glycosyltransferase family 2 protein [Methanobacteriota archaeon]|nr:MAG: glycosyltransferase family 2 protein [Euryarchaeota archaeon]
MATGIEDSVFATDNGGRIDSSQIVRRTTVVIPAFNEERSIASVVLSARKHSNKVIVVNDGSADYTARLASAAGAFVINLPRNRGKGAALSIGLTTAAVEDSDFIVCLDGDGQHNPSDIPRLVETLCDRDADIVIGSRFLKQDSRDQIPRYRRVGQHVLNYATNIGSSEKVTDSQSGFRVFRREVVDLFDYNESGMGIESEMVRSAARMNLRIEEVPIEADYDGRRGSTHNAGFHGATVVGSIIRNVKSEHPLLYFGLGGLIVLTIGIVFATYAIHYYVSIGTLPFGPTLIGLMLSMLGVILMLVGLVLNAVSEIVNNDWYKRERRQGPPRLNS